MVRHYTLWSVVCMAALLWMGWSGGETAPKQRGQQHERGLQLAPEAGGAAPGTEKRTALVIGNATYPEAPLKNPVNDANDMAAALKRLGFSVIVLNNADLRKMQEATEQFSLQLRHSDVGLFYYAGHGVQVNGENYLMPVGARVNREQDVQFEAYNVGRLLGVMEEAGNALNLIILDACRNNPLPRSVRSPQSGLVALQATSGSLIAYATAPGSVASDGGGRNGIYTRNLLRYMQTPGLSVEEMFKQVRISVRQETDKQQTPWESSSLTRSFSFMPAAMPAAATPAPAAPVSAAPAPRPPTQAPAAVVAAAPTPPAPRPTTPPAPASVSVASHRTMVNSLHMEFVLIPSGEFTMGADGSNGIPTHRVVLTRPFYLAKHEVTQAQWASVMGDNPSHFKGEQQVASLGQDIGAFFRKVSGEEIKKELKLDPQRPVERVSWNEVQEFIRRLNAQEGHNKYRLPSEAEWEYAARAGAAAPTAQTSLEPYAWYAQNAKSTTHAVGQLQANAWGLHDMAGNVWEWVQDWFVPYQKETQTNPQGPSTGTLKVLRGGAWNQPPTTCQPVYRLYDSPAFKHLAVGFRLARDAP